MEAVSHLRQNKKHLLNEWMLFLLDSRREHPCCSWPCSLEIISLCHCPRAVWAGHSLQAPSETQRRERPYDRYSQQSENPRKALAMHSGTQYLNRQNGSVSPSPWASASKTNTEHLPQMIQNPDFLTPLLLLRTPLECGACSLHL